ncbi:MAG: T9SS type A sorting domain-containing protein [Bacteroidia bacterium]
MKRKAGFFCGLFCSLYLLAQQPAATLEKGSVSYVVRNNGVLFQQNGNAAFEIPKGSGVHAILSSGLWIGGLDSSGGIRLSIATYDTSGRDFLPGPIDRSTLLPDDSSYWNYVWHVDSLEIADHKTHYNNNGYQAPWSIANWPGSNTRPGNYNPVLAPFIDLNNNSIYEPQLGEIPFVPGTEAAYFIMNDKRAQHQQSGAQGMGLEIYALVYTVAEMPNTVFVKYRIVNRSYSQYNGVFAGLYTDFMLGNPNDNYTSTDSLRNTYFCYNGLPYDSSGYLGMAPVMGVKRLNGKLNRTIGFNWDPADPQGWPVTPEDYYGYLNAVWKDKTELMDPNSSQTSFLYQGDPCNGAGWTEYGSSGVVPGRRNMLGSSGPYTLAHGQSISLDIAYIFTQKQGDVLANVCDFYTDADAVQLYYDQKLNALDQTPQKLALQVYPNPAQKEIYWNLPEGIVSISIQLFDMQGKARNYSASATAIDVTDLANGIYLLRISDGEGNIYQNKVVINH